MPDDQSPSPVADAPADAAAASAPQSAQAPINPREMFTFSKAFEGSDVPVGDPDGASVSNGSDTDAAPAGVKAQDAQPAPEPSEGVKASDAPDPASGADPTPPSRRQEIAAAKDARIAELEAQVAERDPSTLRETLRAEILAEAGQAQSAEKIRADAERFEQSCRMADTDTRLAKIVPDTNPPQNLYEWREAQKALRDSQPEAERAIRADADRRIAQIAEAESVRAKREIAAGWERIKAHQGEAIESSTKLPGVDAAAFKQPGITWKDMAEQIHAAGAAWKEAELADRVTKAEAKAANLEKQLQDRSSEGMADRRAPAVVGRSAGAASGSPTFDPSIGWRGNAAVAFAPNGTG